jgi:hypothetical protein
MIDQRRGRRDLAQGCRVMRRDRSSAIWGTPDVLPTQPQRQPLTQCRGPADEVIY